MFKCLAKKRFQTDGKCANPQTTYQIDGRGDNGMHHSNRFAMTSHRFRKVLGVWSWEPKTTNGSRSLFSFHKSKCMGHTLWLAIHRAIYTWVLDRLSTYMVDLRLRMLGLCGSFYVWSLCLVRIQNHCSTLYRVRIHMGHIYGLHIRPVCTKDL